MFASQLCFLLTCIYIVYQFRRWSHTSAPPPTSGSTCGHIAVLGNCYFKFHSQLYGIVVGIAEKTFQHFSAHTNAHLYINVAWPWLRCSWFPTHQQLRSYKDKTVSSLIRKTEEGRKQLTNDTKTYQKKQRTSEAGVPIELTLTPVTWSSWASSEYTSCLRLGNVTIESCPIGRAFRNKSVSGVSHLIASRGLCISGSGLKQKLKIKCVS